MELRNYLLLLKIKKNCKFGLKLFVSNDVCYRRRKCEK